MIAPSGIEAYRRVDANSRTPLELVVMLYDGALASLHQASVAASCGDVRQRGVAVSKALRIVTSLQENLNLQDGGAVAAELDRLYDYVSRRLLDVTARHDVSGLAESQKILSTLRDAWHQIAARQAQPAVS